MSLPPEIILNLWYYVDEDQQFIFALAGRAYMASGTDEEKTALLRQLAATDYPLALKLPTPDRYVTFYADKMRPGIVTVSELDNPATQLFEEVYQAIEADLVKMAEERNCPVEDYKIPDNPLFVMTALYQEDEGGVRVLGVAA
ncbi:MAG TPA: hypothetical protein HPP94_12425 [Desulfuromonadales bacterium]|nr:hypothetical protein [Desulfuromonadales bacterium]